MKPFFIFLLSVFIFPIVSAKNLVEQPAVIHAADLPLYSKVYDEKRDPFKDAVAALALAKKTNRNVLIEVGGNWCSWCHKMDVFLEKNPEVYQSLHSKYVLLKISVSDSNENEAFMKSLPPVFGYPHMYVSTSAGKMVLSKDTGELQRNGQYNVTNWLTFLNEWQSQQHIALTKQTKANTQENQKTEERL